MGLNFPSSPAVGDVLGDYRWNGTLWTQAKKIKTAQRRNYIVNPAMQVSQENGNTSSNVSGYLPADQWMLSYTGFPSVYTLGGLNNNPLVAPRYIQLTIMAVRPSLSVGDYAVLYHSIEGNRVADLQWGTAVAKPIVVRFSAFAATAGNYALSIRNGGVGGYRAYVTSFAATTAWQEFVIAIPGDTGGSWAKDSSLGMSLSFAPAVGSTYLTTANTWVATNSLGFTGMSNLAAGVAGNLYFGLGHVGLYADPDVTGKAPVWESPNYSDVLLDCQRYYVKMSPHALHYNQANYAAGCYITWPHQWPVPMRVTPAISWDVTSMVVGSTTFHGWDAPTTTGARLIFSATAASSGNNIQFNAANIVVANARM
jgi:hypothetical protein